MVVLKKLKASSLVETIVSSIIILVVFTIALMILRNVFQFHTTSDRQVLKNKLNEIEYQSHIGDLKFPYFEEYRSYNIRVELEEINGQTEILLIAEDRDTGEIINLKRLYVPNKKI